MAFHVVVAPASAKTAVAAIRSLFDQSAKDGTPIYVKAVYRNVDKAPPEFTSNPNFQAVQGDLSDAASLDFDGADAVLAITPPVYEAVPDIVKRAEQVSDNVKRAIHQAASVRKLVLLSSVGAHLEKGVGEIKTNNAAERVFATASVPSITFVRCAYFMENWLMSVDGLKASDPYFFSTVTPIDYLFPMVAIRDIGRQLASDILAEKQLPRSPFIYDLQGPRDYNPLHVQAAFSKALGKDVTIKPVEKSDLEDFYRPIFPPEIAPYWVEMAKCFLPGGPAVVNLPPEQDRGLIRGQTELDEAIQDAVRGLL